MQGESGQKGKGAWAKGIDNLQIPDWRWGQQYQTREFASSFKRTLSRATFINSVEISAWKGILTETQPVDGSNEPPSSMGHPKNFREYCDEAR
jgi:hypothetical protein